MEAMESSLSQLVSELGTLCSVVKEMQADLKSVKSHQQLNVHEQEAAKAAANLEVCLQAAYERFAKYDEDGSGVLDAAEVGAAVNTLTPKEKPASPADIEAIMAEFDRDGKWWPLHDLPWLPADPVEAQLTRSRRACDRLRPLTAGSNSRPHPGNGVLDQQEFRAFVRSMAMAGKLRLNTDLQRDCERIRLVNKADPWAKALRGDAPLRVMLHSLRQANSKKREGRHINFLHRSCSSYRSSSNKDSSADSNPSGRESRMSRSTVSGRGSGAASPAPARCNGASSPVLVRKDEYGREVRPSLMYRVCSRCCHRWCKHVPVRSTFSHPPTLPLRPPAAHGTRLLAPPTSRLTPAWLNSPSHSMSQEGAHSICRTRAKAPPPPATSLRPPRRPPLATHPSSCRPSHRPAFRLTSPLATRHPPRRPAHRPASHRRCSTPTAASARSGHFCSRC